MNETVNGVVSDLTGGAVTLTDAEIGSVLDAADQDAAYALLAETLTARSGIDFSTTGHRQRSDLEAHHEKIPRRPSEELFAEFVLSDNILAVGPLLALSRI